MSSLLSENAAFDLMGADDPAKGMAAKIAQMKAGMKMATAKNDEHRAEKIKEMDVKENKGPLKIGDRVIVKDGGHFDGQHGTVADLWDEETQKYPIDLDLVHPEHGCTVSLTSDAVEAEAAIPGSAEEKRAKLQDHGCFADNDSALIMFILQTLRAGLTGAGETDARKLANSTWQFWASQEGLAEGKKEGIYESAKKYVTDNLTQEEAVQAIEKMGISKEALADAMSSPQAVGGWSVRVSGKFYVYGAGSQGTYVAPVTNPRQIYCVAGIHMPLAVTIREKLPPCPTPPQINLTLLPWYGRIVADTIQSTIAPNRVELATPQMAQELIDFNFLAAHEGRVISRLTQLEVEGGAGTNGVPFKPFATNNPVPQKTAMSNNAIADMINESIPEPQ